jgi:hypothetical protein
MHLEGSGWRKTLAATAVLGCVGEALDTVLIGWPALIFAGIFAGGLAWLLRGGRGGVIVLGLMMLVEVVAFPGYKRDTTTDWVVQIAGLILGAVGTVAATGELVTLRRRRVEQRPAS